MARILVTGASGLLGSNLAVLARDQHEVIGAYHRNPIAIDRVRMIEADLTQDGAPAEVIGRHRPDWVVHCAAATDVDRCEREPDWARAMNVTLAEQVARACRRSGARLAHISTDSVFDGQSGDYREDDLAEPINVYGETKLAGERALLRGNPTALVLRTSLFGWGPDGHRGLAHWFTHRLQAGQSCSGFADVYFSPLYAPHLAQAILELLERRASGLYHLPGRTCLSKYEFGLRLAHALELDSRLVVPGTLEQAALGAKRAKRLCLSGTKVEAALGHRLPEIDRGLRELAHDRELWGAGQPDRPAPPEYAHE